MPLLVLFMILLLNKKSVVGDYTNGTGMNIICVVALLFTSFMAYQAVKGLVSLVASLGG